jgi:nicotinamidase-related amidase
MFLSTPSGRMLVRGAPCNELCPEVAAVAGEVKIHKPGKGAFCRTNLEAHLNALGVTHLIITVGGCTGGCTSCMHSVDP